MTRLVAELAVELFAIAEEPAGEIVQQAKGQRGIVQGQDPDRGVGGEALVTFRGPNGEVSVWVPWEEIVVIGKVDVE